MRVHANFCNFSIYFFRYINSKDVKRIAKMLGFRATKDVFDEMISMYSFHFLWVFYFPIYWNNSFVSVSCGFM